MFLYLPLNCIANTFHIIWMLTGVRLKSFLGTCISQALDLPWQNTLIDYVEHTPILESSDLETYIRLLCVTDVLLLHNSSTPKGIF